MGIQDVKKKRVKQAEDLLFHQIWEKDLMYVNTECIVNGTFEKQSLFSSQQNFSQKKIFKSPEEIWS